MWMRPTKAFNTHWKKLGKSKFGFESNEQQYQILKAKDTWALGTRLLIIPELRVRGVDQMTCGLWEREWSLACAHGCVHVLNVRDFLQTKLDSGDPRKKQKSLIVEHDFVL